jgi:hypothetical protein
MKNEIQLSLSAFDISAGLLCREKPGSNGFRILCYHCPFSDKRRGGLLCSKYRIMIRTRSKYGLRRWKKTRQAILDRDHHSCTICRSGDFLSVHHVDCDPTNDNPENLVTLCDHCHAFIHREAISPEFLKLTGSGLSPMTANRNEGHSGKKIR